MLHWASTAKVDSPLAFDAGVFPDAGTGVGVAQIHGVVCEPNSTGPPIGWLRIHSVALGRPFPFPFESARNSFSPTTSPVSTPRIVRAVSLVWNADVTSCPLSDNVTFFSGTFLGTRTSTSASPPLMRSERFDSVTISKFRGVGSASARKSVVNRHPDTSRLRILMMALLLVRTGLVSCVVKSIHPRLARSSRPREQAAALVTDSGESALGCVARD